MGWHTLAPPPTDPPSGDASENPAKSNARRQLSNNAASRIYARIKSTGDPAADFLFTDAFVSMS